METTDNTINTIEAPLKLTWTGTEYKVNKPNINSIYLVDLEYCQQLLKEKEAKIEGLKFDKDFNYEMSAKHLKMYNEVQSQLSAYSELMERMNTIIREVEVMMEQNNMNDEFDGIWRDSDEEILAATKKLQTDFKNIKE